MSQGGPNTALCIELLGGFRISYGAEEIRDDGWRLAKARSLVKIVLLAPGHSILRDQLVELLWPELDPDSGSNNLHQAMHIARRTLGSLIPDAKPNAILRLRRGVISLDPPVPVQVDLLSFEEQAMKLAGSQNPADFYSALDLYRGDLLPDDLYEDWAFERRLAAREQYTALLDRLSQLHIARQEATPAIDALRRIVAIEPDQEEAHRSLMELYARTGRRQQALRQYERLRDILERELELEPEPETDDLYQAILSGEFPADIWETEQVDAPAQVERPEIRESIADFMRRSGDFVGRSKELELLQSGLERVIGGRGEIILIAGEPGIGKTRITEEFLRFAGAQGVRTFWGRCYEGDGAPAYWPWLQIIRSFVDTRPATELRAAMGPGAADIARIAPAIREHFPDLEESPQLDPDGDRFRLFDSMTTFLKNAASRVPLALIIDDLHTADRSSLLLLEFLAREIAEAGILIIGSYRHVEVDRNHPLTHTLGHLARQDITARITLDGLNPESIERFIELATGRTAPDGLAEAIHDQTEGNPYFVREIVSLLIDEERLDNPDDVRSWRLTIPPGIRETVALRTSTLSEMAHRVLTTASVSGRDFELPIVAEVAGLDELDTLDGLEEALGNGLVVESPVSAGGFRFSHAITRETLYDQLSHARRLRMHLRTGQAIERQAADSVDALLPTLAHHFGMAASIGASDTAIDYLRRAGQQAMEQIAYSEAATYFGRALDLAQSQDRTDDVGELLLMLAEAQLFSGDTLEARQSYRLAADSSRQSGDRERFAQAALGVETCGQFSEAAHEEIVCLLEEALELFRDDPSPAKVMVLSRLADAQHYRVASSTERSRLAEAAVALASEIDDARCLATALISHLNAHWNRMNLGERLAQCDRVVAIARDDGNPQLELAATAWQITALMEEGDIKNADIAIDTYARIAAHLRQPQNIWSGLTRQTMRALMLGRFEVARSLAEQAHAVGRRSAPGAADLTWFTHRFLISYLSGNGMEDIHIIAEEQLKKNPQFPILECMTGTSALTMGDRERAEALLDGFLGRVADGLPDNTLRLPTLALGAELVHLLQAEAAVEQLAEALGPYNGRNVFGGNSICLGAADHYTGLLHLTLGQRDKAHHDLRRSLKSNTRMEALPFIARDEYAMGLGSCRTPEASSGMEAEEHFKRAMSIAESIGMSRLASDAGRFLDIRAGPQASLATEREGNNVQHRRDSV